MDVNWIVLDIITFVAHRLSAPRPTRHTGIARADPMPRCKTRTSVPREKRLALPVCRFPALEA